MRVTFVNRFYWPAEPATAQLLGDLAEGLAASGASVRVIAGHHAAGLPARETRAGVEIVRVGAEIRATQSLVRRARDFADFRAAARAELQSSLQPGEIVVALTDPPLISVTAAEITSARHARLVHWVHDIYPEVFHAVARSPLSWLSRKLLAPRRNAAWRQADACITLGDDMAGVLRDAGVDPQRLHVIPNWAPQGLAPATLAETAALRQAWGLPADEFIVGYSGNLGRVHDLDGLLEVATALREDAVVFLFIGGGAAFARLQQEAQRRGLARVRFLPPQPRHLLSVALGVPDLHVASLRDGCERLVFPSKLYGVAAAGRPMLALAPPHAEISRIVAREGLGAAFRPRDTMAIATFVRALAADPVRRRELGAAAQRFDFATGGAPRALAAWTDVLRKLDARA